MTAAPYFAAEVSFFGSDLLVDSDFDSAFDSSLVSSLGSESFDSESLESESLESELVVDPLRPFP